MDMLLEHIRNGIWLALLLSMPATLLAAGIGLIVGIVQAATQIQEQTISAAPKILGVMLLIAIGGSLMVQMLVQYQREAAQLAFEVIPKSEPMVLQSSRHGNQLAMRRGKSGSLLKAMPPASVGGPREAASTRVITHGKPLAPHLSVSEQLAVGRSDYPPKPTGMNAVPH